MGQYHRYIFPLAFGILFLVATSQSPAPGQPGKHVITGDRVVIAAPIQVLMFGGDRFLAANLETIRISATAVDIPPESVNHAGSYLVRAHSTVAQLNPCHEDNYYLGNALLSWAGAAEEGQDILHRAMECRTWDEFPAFFYGFNQYFFFHNLQKAQQALKTAASRSTANRSALEKLAIMLAVGEIKDDRMALGYLKNQRDQTTDPKLRHMLDRRVTRLEGLITLRNAQQLYEEQFGRPLKAPGELLAHGILGQYPDDPLGLGYEFRDGIFHLRRLKIQGMENPQ